jgi:hypothetical protein
MITIRRLLPDDLAGDECRRAVAMMVLVAVGAMLPACQPSVASQGQKRDVLAAYQFRTLEAKLGPEVQVLTVRAAAEQALRSRGYVVSAVSGAADRSRIEAKAAGKGELDKVVIESWVGNRFTGVSVTCEPWGDEAESRAVLDAVLNRLGR